MQNSELKILLENLSKKDFYKFGKFLRSPYHNNKKILVDFFELLKRYSPGFSSPQLRKEKIYGNLFPGKFYNDGTMRNILSDMKEKAELFLAFEYFLKDSRQIHLYKLINFRRYNIEKSYMQYYSKIRDKLKKIDQVDADLFYTKFMFHHEYDTFILKYESKFKIEDKLDNLSLMHESLINSWLINSLRIYIQALIVQKASKKHKFDLIHVKEIEEIYQKAALTSEMPQYLKFIYNCFKLLQTDKKNYFDGLMEFKKSRINVLNDSDKSNLYNTLIYFCHSYTMKGHYKYLGILFSIAKEYVEKKLYREGSLDHIPEYVYMNILTIGLLAGETDWAENFYKAHIGKVMIDNRETLALYSEANILYAKNRFGDALEKLAKISTKNFPQLNIFAYKYKIKSLQLKIFYDSNELESFYLILDSLKHFINNEKLTVLDNKSKILNFLYFSKKLSDLKNDLKADKAYEAYNLKNEIIDNDSVMEKIWLLTKVKDLEENINDYSSKYSIPV